MKKDQTHSTRKTAQALEFENSLLKIDVKLALRDYHDITYREAKDLSLSFVQDNMLSGFAQDQYIACYFRKDMLQSLIRMMTGPYPGIIFYLCYNNEISIPENGRYFVAFKMVQDFDKNDLSRDYIDVNETMWTGIHYRKYNKSANEAGMEDFYFHDMIAVTDSHPTIPESQVQRFYKAFRDTVKDTSGYSYNEYPFGFINKKELNDFITEDSVAAVKLLLGLDNTDQYNRIKIILSQSDANGKIIFSMYHGRVTGKFLERSHP